MAAYWLINNPILYFNTLRTCACLGTPIPLGHGSSYFRITCLLGCVRTLSIFHDLEVKVTMDRCIFFWTNWYITGECSYLYFITLTQGLMSNLPYV